MSKYRIIIRPSVHKQVSVAALYIALLSSVFLWQPNVFALQVEVQLLLFFLLVGQGWYQFKRDKEETQPQIVSLCEQGSWLQIEPESSLSWQIDGRSLVTSWFVWLCLSPPFSPKVDWQIVFRDQVSERDFRCLCRTSLRQKKAAEKED